MLASPPVASPVDPAMPKPVPLPARFSTRAPFAVLLSLKKVAAAPRVTATPDADASPPPLWRMTFASMPDESLKVRVALPAPVLVVLMRASSEGPPSMRAPLLNVIVPLVLRMNSIFEDWLTIPWVPMPLTVRSELTFTT